ncbi:MAG TPA: hypothetical protein VJN90_01640 [Candidatus Acidoferrales bacterium]|nr:hypothetical protein [Candidatus Acidoferrales bacterium]
MAWRSAILGVAVLIFLLSAPAPGRAQETPYFVSYSHHLEEPGNFEIESNSILGTQRPTSPFLASSLSFEYGVKAWWTTEVYLEGQSTFGDSALFTGVRWENRLRPLMHEHWINPLLYFEFENINGADKTLLEVVGHDSEADMADLNATARIEHKREIETKLILSSDFKGWNVSENFIAEKNLAFAPWEFGYAIGASRPLRLDAAPRPCNFCRENFLAGAEFYGGLGSTESLTLSATSHYGATIVGWQLPNGMTFRLSPGWGLNDRSHRFLLRWGVSYEVGQIGRHLRRMF